jgi:hypothetical protein
MSADPSSPTRHVIVDGEKTTRRKLLQRFGSFGVVATGGIGLANLFGDSSASAASNTSTAASQNAPPGHFGGFLNTTAGGSTPAGTASPDSCCYNCNQEQGHCCPYCPHCPTGYCCFYCYGCGLPHGDAYYCVNTSCTTTFFTKCS